MAEENDEDLILQPADAGAAFRFEMAATNFFMGYWKYVLGALITLLVGILIYGQYQNYVTATQRGCAAEIADVERELPAQIAMLSFQKAQGQLTATSDELAALGGKLEAVADSCKGTASLEARLKAAELYRVADKSEQRRAALEASLGNADGLLRFAAESALAALDLEEGKGDEAVQRFRTLMNEEDGFLAQQAAIELGLALEHLDRDAEASKVYSEFLTKWPDAARSGEVRDFQSRVGTAG